MAIIYCPDCGTEISDKAEKCSKCSYPINKIVLLSIQENNTTTNDFAVWFGYVSAVISILFFPIIFMGIGVACGAYNISKKQPTHGIIQIVISIVFGVVGILLGIMSDLF